MDFKILCIDDEPTWLDSIRSGIEDHLREMGYEPEIIWQENGSNIDAFLHRPDINLIMVDYNLPGSKGNEVVAYILNKGTFVELVFYSQDETTIRKALGKHVDLVHFKGREEVQDLVINLCTYSDYRYKNVDVMRGLIVAEAIDLEKILEEIMIKTFGSKGSYFKEEVLKEGMYDYYDKYKFVVHKIKNAHRQINEQLTASGGEDQQLKALLDKLVQTKDGFTSFVTDVIHTRNTVAHGQKSYNADGSVQLKAIGGGADILFTKEWIAERRQKFAKYRDSLNEMLSLSIF